MTMMLLLLLFLLLLWLPMLRLRANCMEDKRWADHKDGLLQGPGLREVLVTGKEDRRAGVSSQSPVTAGDGGMEHSVSAIALSAGRTPPAQWRARSHPAPPRPLSHDLDAVGALLIFQLVSGCLTKRSV